MKILDISKDDLFHFLTNSDCIGQGCFGILSEYDNNTLIKIYYKELIETYISKDINKLDEEITNKIEIQEELKKLRPPSPNDKEIEELNKKKNELLEQMGVLKGLVYYRGIEVGTLINYYKGYEELGEIYPKLSCNNQRYLLDKIKNKLTEHIKNNLYLTDLKEDNVLVNPQTLEIAFIDLDDLYTRYEEKEYIIEHNLKLGENTNEQYTNMVRRLINK